jgi:tetratricopeptide (TPR) repeat protein
MLRPKKKLTRREIKQDKLVTAYFKIYDRIYSYRKQLITGVVAVAVVALGLILYFNNIQAENERALTELGKVYPIYDEENYQRAIDGIPERGIMGLRDIAANFKRTDAGKTAAFYLANAYYHLGRYDEAYTYFNDFRGSDNLLRASALAGRAAIYEIRGDYARAAELFEQAATRFGQTAITPENLRHAGRNYLEAGNSAQALRIFEKIQSDYPETAIARDVDRFIAQIKVSL